ncbi:beta-ribofuranosylaminobenzene 5'-phosphate synthase family protein [Ciceribacter azotifigens]|uniref:beta-ribofuranosylaminobenzene 5'-phosphate synthase family protein n=1 Tax=Ciceribacter azotifigens TaxID=2069303 RepID=UPI003A88C3EE
MSDSVTIQVPARLHLGFLDIPGKTSGRFGSIGLPLETISTVLTVARARETSVEGGEQARIRAHIAKLSAHLGIDGHHKVIVHRTIPSHSGLGSGTQLALAVSAALRTLHQLPFAIRDDAVFLGRGTRSGIGIAAFDRGGLIIDAGKGQDDQAPTVISRIPFPENWRIILVFDHRHEGIHGEAEITAFRALPPFAETSSSTICRTTLMALMPSLIEGDLATFGKAVETIQYEIGRYFAPAQGGLFTSKAVETAVRKLAVHGAVGIGQSSWGPTGFAFTESQEAAEQIVDDAGIDQPGLSTRIVPARNLGAKITQTVMPPQFGLRQGRFH